MTTKRLEMAIRVTTRGTSAAFNLDGHAWLEAGMLEGDIRCRGGELRTSEAHLLTAFTFTGCPIAAKTSVPHLNPWIRTEGAYVGRRTLTSRQFKAESSLVAENHGDTIVMALTLDLRGRLPDLVGIASPFQECITPIGSDRLQGHFQATFRDALGCLHECAARTEYLLPYPDDLCPVYRNITIGGFGLRGRFRQMEQISMFGDRPSADDDLRQRKGTVALSPANHRLESQL